MTDHSSAVIESQVDWLTCSAHSEDRSRQLSDLADDLLTGAEAAGNHRVGWRSMGYLGYHCGQIDWGRRDERQAILRVTGGSAHTHLRRVLEVSDYVSRLDVAVTWRAAPPDPHIGRNAYSLADLWYRKHPRAMQPSFHGDAAGGYTCYLGDRRSPYYARIYNKEAERASRQDDTLAQHYAGCWRYEVEAHDQRAVALASAVADSGQRADWIQEWLYQFFTTRGITTPFPATGEAVLVAGFHRRSDDQTRLRHLARNVAPTVARLQARGLGREAREALGLEPGEKLLTRLEQLLRL